MLATVRHGRLLVFVFARDLENYIQLSPASHRYQVALGRVVAHELEHVRRGSRDHDRRGWFVACLWREDLTSPWFGAPGEHPIPGPVRP